MRRFCISVIVLGLTVNFIAARNEDEPIRSLPDLQAPYTGSFIMPMREGRQDTLWAQYPNPGTASSIACQRDTVYPFDAWALDDVIPPAGGGNYEIEEVVSWWECWNGFTSWTLVSDIHFQVYEDSGLGYAFPKIMPSQEVTVLPANYTATTIGTDQYLVEMTLPSTVILPAGEISWICVQPSNVFTLNGQTGWMCEVGIGNGQECYHAFPLLGNEKWVTATWAFGFPFEAGFALLGSEGNYPGYIWDFEDGTMQGWVHTNGLSYPAGWDIIDAGTANWPPPDMGSYCLGIDDDAAGSGTSVIDTVLSPIFTDFADDWLYWGIGYNNIGSDWVDVVIAYNDGSWNYDLVKHYTADQGGYSYGVWDSVDVSGYSANYYRLMLVFNDGGVWAWWCEIDNIGPIGPYCGWSDVAAVAFLNPETNVEPGPHDVIGIVTNYGPYGETYDVHCVVTDPTFAVVLDETVNVTTPAGENDTINFGEVWFNFHYSYDLTMATLLDGDLNPANDTLEQVTVTYGGGYWDSWTNIDQPRSGAYAGEWLYGYDGYVYCFGGNPGPLATAIKYDGSDWNNIPSMPVGSSYGGNASVDGKVYLIGAWTGQNGLLTIFDCASETYSSRDLPVPIADPAIAVYQDNYIYSIGGSNPPGWAGSTIVQLYDIAADSFWTQVTQLPAACSVTTATAGYIGNDTLIVSGGYDAGATSKTTMGSIDPGNPADVSWTTGIPHPGAPAYRCYGDAITDGEDLYGLVVVGGSPYTAQAYMYLSNEGWITLADKITACSNSGAVSVDLGWYFSRLFTVGGSTGSYLNAFEVFHWQWHMGLQETPDDGVTKFGFSCISSNPVKDRVRFSLSLPRSDAVRFQVFDITGRQVIDSHYSTVSQGKHTLFWDLRDEQGREIAAGTYFYSFTAGKYNTTGKLIVLR